MTDLGDFGSYDPSDDDGPPAGDQSPGGGDRAPTGGEPGDRAGAGEHQSRDGEASGGAEGGDATSGPTAAADEQSFTAVSTDAGAAERPDAALGALAVSEGLRIDDAGEETRLRAYVTADRRETVRVGSYVMAPYPGEETLFCRVRGLEYVRAYRGDDATEIHARRAMRSAGVDERDYKLIADLEPVAILSPDEAAGSEGDADGDGDGASGTDGADELVRRAPDRVPKPETAIRAATERAEIKAGLQIPTEGIFLGHLSVGGELVRTAAEPPEIDYRLNDDYDAGDPLVFRHTLVAGGTGSGKTHAAKNVLRQLLAEERTYPVAAGADREVRAAVVQFDPQDEYAQMHDDNPDADAADRRWWDARGIAHGGHEDTVAFVPEVGSATYAADHHRAEQVSFTVPFAMVRYRPWLVAGASLNDNQYGALDHLLDRFFGANAAGTYEEFASFLEDPALREELDESGRIHEATYDAVRRRVLSAPGQVFDGAAAPVTDQVRTLVRPGGLTVVPTYHIANSRAAETVVLAVASLLVDEKLSNDPEYGRIDETPLVLGMDEAHNFLSDAETVQARRVVGKFTEAAKQGRKERLGLFLVTQDPQDVADPVFKQVNTRLVLNLGDEDAIGATNIPPALERKVPYMERGQLVVHSPDNSESVELTGLSRCVTRHGRD